MIKFVIFDVGGVLIRWEDEWLLDAFTRKYEIDKRNIGKYYYKWLKKSWTGEISEIEFLKRIIKAVGIKSSPQSMRVFWKSVFRKRSSMNKDVVSVVKNLHKNGYKLGVISNTSGKYRAQLYVNRFKRYFNSTVMSCDVGMKKPERRIFVYVMRRLHAKPKECIFIDDKMEHVKGAHKAGMFAIHFRNVKQLRHDLKKLGVKI